MNGLELSREYFESFGRPLLENDFSGLLPYVAVGLIGSGSECLGFDDEVSRDHDFEPGFCIFLPGEETVSVTPPASVPLRRMASAVPWKSRTEESV